MENTQDYQDYQDYRAEILGIVRSNASPGIMRNKLEDYHEKRKTKNRKTGKKTVERKHRVRRKQKNRSFPISCPG